MLVNAFEKHDTIFGLKKLTNCLEAFGKKISILFYKNINFKERRVFIGMGWAVWKLYMDMIFYQKSYSIFGSGLVS